MGMFNYTSVVVGIYRGDFRFLSTRVHVIFFFTFYFAFLHLLFPFITPGFLLSGLYTYLFTYTLLIPYPPTFIFRPYFHLNTGDRWTYFLMGVIFFPQPM